MNAQLGALLFPERSASVTQKWKTAFVFDLGARQRSAYICPESAPKKPWVRCATVVLFFRTVIVAATSPRLPVTLNGRFTVAPQLPKAGNASAVGAGTVGHAGPSPAAEQGLAASGGAVVAACPVASSSAAPASSTPQPIVGVQRAPALRRADCLMMSATW